MTIQKIDREIDKLRAELNNPFQLFNDAKRTMDAIDRLRVERVKLFEKGDKSNGGH